MQASPRRVRTACAAVLAMAAAASAGAGTWSQLPEAIARLSRRSDDGEALAVMAAAERSVLVEATAGHLDSVAALMDAYAGLVSPLPDGAERVASLERRAAAALLALGDARRATDPAAAGAAWALAATIDTSEEVVGRLSELLLPPGDPQPGEVWTSPVNRSQLVWLPPFRFIMGCTQGDHECQQNERYLRWVEVPGVWIERTEVTNRMYRACVEAGACTPPAEESGFADAARGNEPVVRVSWHQARAYTAWLGRRLPSEAEWERCARGKRGDWRFPWGDSRLRSQANLYGKSEIDVFAELAPAGSFPATGWGHFDLAGNVWEWCEDTYHQVLTEGPRDGRPWTEGGWGRVLRGGSWRRTTEMARVSARTWQEPEYVADDVGFRCAVDARVAPDAQRLAAMAARVFLLRGPAGHALEATDLVAEDRRYLERRAVTWLVLEGRSWEALPWARVLLEHDASDPVAVDLLGRLEEQLLRGVGGSDLKGLEEGIERYRAAVASGGPLAERRAAVEKELLRTLQSSGRELQRRGDLRAAAGHFRLALSLAPGDPKLLNLLRSALPSPGTVRAWEGDHRPMVWIPAGSFLMGRSRGDDLAALDEQPAHTVWVDGFWLDRNEVTNADYHRCMEAGACTEPHAPEPFRDPALANHPVLAVDWYQARQYARWTGKRLPTEAEWERAARAGTSTRYPWGDEWVETGGNDFGARELDRWPASSPVGSFSANPWGLYDMLGNTWEWVEDVYHSDYHDAPRDGRAWTQVTGGGGEPDRVLRGGSFLNFPPKLRVSQRDRRPPDGWSRTTGFRCAASD